MILEEVQARKSEFAFASKVLEDEKIDSLFEAARLAPSSMNIQPWRFFFAKKGTPEFQLILDTLFEGNQKWAKEASILILSIAQLEYTYNDKKLKNAYAWHDTGMANAHIMLQAANLGLISHPMGGFDHLKATDNFNIPEDYRPITIIAIGYKGDESKLPEELLKRQTAPRKRKELSEIVLKGKLDSKKVD